MINIYLKKYEKRERDAVYSFPLTTMKARSTV